MRRLRDALVVAEARQLGWSVADAPAGALPGPGSVTESADPWLLLGLFYALLLVFPQAVALTAITGVIDNWLVFRKKPVKPNDENEL